ncbi:MAG: polysulfide reductase NrfD [Campylobacteraceae bacterium]|nr:polysulfide reductase NrfD [Campylobacteraceae bacterium]
MQTLSSKKNTAFNLGISLLVFSVGLYGIGMVFFHGQESSYAVSRELPLGLLLLGYAFFVGISVGLSTLAALVHVFKFEVFEYRSKCVALMALTFLIAAFWTIFWELGGPFELQVLRFVRYYINFQIESPIWWMCTFYIIETPLLILELWLLFKGGERASFWASIVAFIMGIVAFSTLSMVFAVNAARPLWNTAQFTISFVLGALLSGASLLTVFMRFRAKEVNQKTLKALATYMLFCLIAIAFVHAWTVVISSYTAGSYLSENIKMLTNGPLSFNFYFFQIFVGIVLPITLLIASKFKNLTLVAVAGICAIIGVFFTVYDGVVGGQLIRVESEFLPVIELVEYTPSLAEISIFISSFGVAMLLYEIGYIVLNLGKEDK